MAIRKPLTLSELAARWYIRMRHTTLDTPERREFEQWLSLDPRHAAEYESIAGVMRQLDSKDTLVGLGRCRRATSLFGTGKQAQG